MLQNQIIEEVYQDYFTTLLAGDRRRSCEIVDRLIEESVPIRDVYIQLFQTALYEIGNLWESNLASVATEHVATSITESLMVKFYPQLFAAPRKYGKVLIACVASEYHQIGAKMVADILQLRGWGTLFLGANTPVDAIVDMAQKENPGIIALSQSIYFNIPELHRLLPEITQNLQNIPILLGGQAFRHGGSKVVEQYDNVHVLKSLAALEAHMDKLEKKF
jgi:MerR family transcriptional regulator, light-induced transcriptional regulator